MVKHVHLCLLDGDCRRYGAPRRLYLTDIRGWSLIVGARSQAWYPWSGNTKVWRWITVHPDSERYCGHVVKWLEGRSGKPRPLTCSRLKGHRGRHRAPDWGLTP